ncbi:hypothetical protein [Streptomyces sp. NPDC045369]|uniref:hypothetical protein n=1 Tax=Streptomyces sp. NPDC045369 TaxID=3155732 RepID=UPI0033F061F0
MTETSWPHDQGDGQRVDAQRWQVLTAAGAPSGVIGRWGDSALSVSVSTSQAAAIDVAPGTAIVRGFAYKADQPVTLPLSVQTSPSPRIDLVVLELDMAAGAVRARVLKGQPAAAPVPPGVRQVQGGVWQYPLAEVTVKKGVTAVQSIRDVRTLHDAGRPPAVQETTVPAQATPGDLRYYKAASTGAEELHMYAANGGWSVVSAIGKARTYTPRLSWNGGSHSAKGRYQWVASNVIHFSANVTNTSGRTWSGTQMSVSLPTKSRGGVWQLVNATLLNNTTGKAHESMPNYLIGNAYIGGGSTCQPVFQTYTQKAINGGDWWERFPKGATLIVSGTYEADYFHEGNG